MRNSSCPPPSIQLKIGDFFTKWLVDLVQDSQHKNGSFAHVAPDVGIGGGAVAWGDAAIICPYLVYRFYGDTRGHRNPL